MSDPPALGNSEKLGCMHEQRAISTLSTVPSALQAVDLLCHFENSKDPLVGWLTVPDFSTHKYCVLHEAGVL